MPKSRGRKIKKKVVVSTGQSQKVYSNNNKKFKNMKKKVIVSILIPVRFNQTIEIEENEIVYGELNEDSAKNILEKFSLGSAEIVEDTESGNPSIISIFDDETDEILYHKYNLPLLK